MASRECCFPATALADRVAGSLQKLTQTAHAVCAALQSYQAAHDDAMAAAAAVADATLKHCLTDVAAAAALREGLII